MAGKIVELKTMGEKGYLSATDIENIENITGLGIHHLLRSQKLGLSLSKQIVTLAVKNLNRVWEIKDTNKKLDAFYQDGGNIGDLLNDVAELVMRSGALGIIEEPAAPLE